MNYLSLCAIIKNEGPYLVEWVNHYLKQGFEHLYLYDNDSDDNPREILKEFSDFITWDTVKGMRQQRTAYNNCIQNYKHDTEWCAFLDCDEFLYSTRDRYFINTLKTMYDSNGISGVAPHWLIFGSNGELEYRDEPVTKRFTRRGAAVNQHVKSIMRLSKTLTVNMDPHSFIVSDGYVVAENIELLEKNYALHNPATANILRINHYVTKSKGEFYKRRQLPKADSGVYVDIDEQFRAHDLNEVEDKDIWYLS